MNLSFIFEPGPIPCPRGEVDLEEPALDSLPLAPDFGSRPFLVGGWQPEGEFDLPEDSEFTPWELPFKGNVELEPDISVDAWARDVNGFELPDSAKPKIPDISKGLGKRRDRVDLVALQKFVAQSQRFILLGDQLCVYYPPCWRKLSDLEAEREIRALIESHNQGYCLTNREYEQLRKGLLGDPSVLCLTGEVTPAAGKINFLDGAFDIASGRFLPHDPRDNFFSAINVKFKDVPRCSGRIFEDFVSHISGENPDVREQLLQLVALTILCRPLKHFFVLVGPSNTGKTQFGRFLEELVGQEQTMCVRDVHDFGDRWTIGSLEGKMLALCLDLPDSVLPPRAVGIVKQLVGDDAIKAERKYENSRTYHSKPLLLMAGNHPLRIPKLEREAALLNRMVTIYFQNPVGEREMRQELYKDLLDEAPYIVGEAIEAYYRLEQNGFELTRVPIPAEYAPQDARSGYRSVGRFLEECCEFAPGSETTTQALFEAYCTYNESAPISQIDFSRKLKEQMKQRPQVSWQPRIGGKDQRGYRGIRLLPQF